VLLTASTNVVCNVKFTADVYNSQIRGLLLIITETVATERKNIGVGFSCTGCHKCSGSSHSKSPIRGGNFGSFAVKADFIGWLRAPG
jgi:hypothetical protein